MARLLSCLLGASSFPLLLVLLRLASASREFPDSAFGKGDLSALGNAYDINFRIGSDYTYIPNYGDTRCDQYVTYNATTGDVSYNPAGSVFGGAGANESCCGRNNTRQACGPEFWVFSETTSNNGDSFHKCQPTNTKLNDQKDNNQQSPINIQTVATFSNKPLPLPTINTVPSVYPAPSTNRSATGFTFTSTLDALHKFDLIQCQATFTAQAGVWEVDMPASGCDETVRIGGKTFRLAQFHLHSAEHTVNGMYYPAEVHAVHFEWDGKTMDTSKPLVLGFFLTVGCGANAYMQKVINGFGQSFGTTSPISPYFLIKQVQAGGYWHYIGSLTTPPCQVLSTSYVRWFVFKKPLQVSATQLQYFSSYFNQRGLSYNGQNNRPVQRLLNNTVVYSQGPPIF